jgi:hypothetical protein
LERIPAHNLSPVDGFVPVLLDALLPRCLVAFISIMVTCWLPAEELLHIIIEAVKNCEYDTDNID